MASSTARIIESRDESQPTTARLAVPSEVGATSACTSTRTGLVPSIPAKTAAPGALVFLSPKKSSEGLVTSRKALVGHFENADFIRRAKTVLHRSEDSVMMAAIAFKIKDRIDHVFHDARTAIWPSLVTCHPAPWQPGLLGKADHGLNAGAHLRYRSGCRIGNIAPQRLNGINDNEIRPLAFRKGGQNVFNIRLGSQKNIGSKQHQPLRPQPHLCHRFFAGHIDNAMTLAGERAAAACMRSVDFPMPGSPPTRTAEPLTKPPLLRGSSSLMPV